MAKKPKLELNEGEEVHVRLTHAQPVSGKSGFGEYNMYSVAKPDGSEYVFFAPDEIHRIISERNLSRGSEFVMRKVKGKLEIVLTGNGERQLREESDHEDGNCRPDNFKELMKACVSEAVEITREVNTIPWQNEDVRSIALTMFIQRARLS